jgi:diguanylate cyclase (GGDEF)-like protein
VLFRSVESAHYDLRITPLVRSHVAIGHLLVLHDITERKRREDQLEHLAAHDPLTGVANRRTLEVTLESALRSTALGSPSALLYIDADGFKAVNDTLGHSAGDLVLASLAQSIGRQLRGGDLLARVGGDEFAVLLTGLDTPLAFPVAERIRREIAQDPIVIGGHRFRVTLSIGLVGLIGSMTPDTALRAADAAMYLAKQRGRDRVVVEEETAVVAAQ